MDEGRLPTNLLVDACIQQLTSRATPYYLLQKGDPNSGIILLKLNGLENGCKLLIQQRDLDGVLGWENALGEDLPEEKDADDYIQRSKNRDPDLWVIEVEDRDLVNPFDV